MKKECKNIKEITLCSKKDSFPIKVIFMDKGDTATDYILLKTRKEKLVLQKPLLTGIKEKHQTK